jgi:Tfp pilus assembly protein PilO
MRFQKIANFSQAHTSVARILTLHDGFRWLNHGLYLRCMMQVPAMAGV